MQIEDMKLPAAPLKRDLHFAPTSCRESSKWKDVIPFYCGSLANPVCLRQTEGNALALLNFPKGTLFNGAS